jgi:RNA polymerase sigma factor (TIGR02999 family)
LGDVTALLARLGRGDREAFERLLPLVYGELVRLAHRHRYQWDGGGPGTQSLVHEAYLKLAAQARSDWASRAQFFHVASLAMRSILIDNARRRKRRKRAGEARAVPLDDAALVSRERADDLLALDAALDRLEEDDQRLARIVECRFFGGLTVDETAEALGISPATVKRGWDRARVRLFEDLGGRPAR